MSEFDIFKLIRSTPERKPKQTRDSAASRPEIDDFIRGTEERKYKERNKKKEVKRDEFDEEISESKKEKKFKNSIRKINLVELDKLSVKNQNKILIKEYIMLYEQLDSYERELEKFDNTTNNQSIKIHQLQKESHALKNLIRETVALIPNGSEVKRTVETNSWDVHTVEPLVLSKIAELVDRAKNLDVHVEEATKQLTIESKSLQKKYVQQQADITKRDQYIEELKSFYEAQMQTIANQNQQNVFTVQAKYEAELTRVREDHQTEVSALKQQLENLQSTIQNTPTTQPIHAAPVPQAPETPAPTISLVPAEDAEFSIPVPKFEDAEDSFGAVEPEIPDLSDTPAFSIEEPEIPEIEIPTTEHTHPINKTTETPKTTAKKEPEEPTIPPLQFTTPDSTPPSFQPPVFEPPAFEPPAFEEAEPEAEEEELEDELVMFDPEPYLQTLSDTNKAVIKVIGSTGVSRNKELRTAIEDNEETQHLFMKGNKFNQQDMSSTIKGLKDAGFLISDSVKLGAKGGFNFNVYELSSLGKGIYQSLAGKKPVVSEKKLITDQHASLEHGYLIKESALEFEEMGYTVYTERKDLRFDLPNGKRKDFDLIIEKDGKKCMIEVERGTHNEEDFFNAMDKILQITNEFYFICPNEQIMFGKTKIAFFRWIKERLGGIQNAKGKLTANFTTLEKVKKRGKTIWEPVDFK